MFYQENRKRARTINTEPTMTDQTQAAETDLNTIVGRMMTTGQMPGQGKAALYGDFTGLPLDLRAMIHQVKDLERLRGELPEQLAQLSVEEIAQLPAAELKRILTPPQTTEPEVKTT